MSLMERAEVLLSRGLRSHLFRQGQRYPARVHGRDRMRPIGERLGDSLPDVRVRKVGAAVTPAELEGKYALAKAAPDRRPGSFGPEDEQDRYFEFHEHAKDIVLEMAAEIRRLREALEDYADGHYDSGNRARAALGEP